MDFLDLNPLETQKNRKLFVETDLLRNSRVVAAIAYDQGKLFVVENPFSREGSYFTDPLTRHVGFLGTGAYGHVRQVRQYLMERAFSEQLLMGNRLEEGDRAVSARYLTEKFLAPGLRTQFEAYTSAPLKTNVLLADMLGQDPDFFCVSYDGVQIVKRGFASLGGKRDTDTDAVKNAAEEHMRRSWRPDMSLADALTLGVQSLRAALQTPEEQGGVDKERFAKAGAYIEQFRKGNLLELSVIDRRLGSNGRDCWASILPAREAATYDAPPIAAPEAVRVIADALR